MWTQLQNSCHLLHTTTHNWTHFSNDVIRPIGQDNSQFRVHRWAHVHPSKMDAFTMLFWYVNGSPTTSASWRLCFHEQKKYSETQEEEFVWEVVDEEEGDEEEAGKTKNNNYWWNSGNCCTSHPCSWDEHEGSRTKSPTQFEQNHCSQHHLDILKNR